MARQYLVEGPFIDPPISAPLSADVATTAVAMWTAATYTPIYANDPKAGKIYIVEAGGIISTSTSGTLTITPSWTNGAVNLGTSTAQTVVVSLMNVPWFLKFIIVFRSIGAAGNNSTVTTTGSWEASGAAGTAGSGMQITFGSTATTNFSVDATVNSAIQIQKTLSVAGSWSTNWCYIYARN